jgi:hypothetical protein
MNKKVVFCVSLMAMVLFMSYFLCAQENFERLQAPYLQYGLIPMTEPPGENERDYTLWENAYKSIISLDKDLSTNSRWLDVQKREVLMKNKLEEHNCNYHVKQFNLGHYGNRFYSVLSGSQSRGATQWTCKIWYMYNPANKKDIGPSNKRIGAMNFSMDGSKVLGEYRSPNNLTGRLEGTLSENTITYIIGLNNGKTMSGTMEVRTPGYIFGKWHDDPGSPRDAYGEWEFFKQFEIQDKPVKKMKT